ncbi:hypothetical protein LEMLEM_LOCUS10912 [Lemmus lemmus]
MGVVDRTGCWEENQSQASCHAAVLRDGHRLEAFLATGSRAGGKTGPPPPAPHYYTAVYNSVPVAHDLRRCQRSWERWFQQKKALATKNAKQPLQKRLRKTMLQHEFLHLGCYVKEHN